MGETLRAVRLDAGTIAATIPVDPLEPFSRCFGLSPREVELLGHLAAGRDTRDLADRMYLSEHTVQDHLKSIVAKASVHNRRGLL